MPLDDSYQIQLLTNNINPDVHFALPDPNLKKNVYIIFLLYIYYINNILILIIFIIININY